MNPENTFIFGLFMFAASIAGVAGIIGFCIGYTHGKKDAVIKALEAQLEAMDEKKEP